MSIFPEEKQDAVSEPGALHSLIGILTASNRESFVKFPDIWSSWGVFQRELLRIRRIWIQALLSPLLFNLLIVFAFSQMQPSNFSFLATTLSKEAQLRAFLAAYTITSIIQHASGNIMSSLFPTKYHGVLESLLVSPTPRWGIIGGYVGGGIFKSLLVQALLLPIINIFFPLHLYSWLNFLALSTLCAACFSLLGMSVALIARSFDELSFISTFLILPSTFLSGRFFSLEILPTMVKQLLYFNPLRLVIKAVQEAWLGPIGGECTCLMALYPLMILTIALLFLLNHLLLKWGYGNQFR